MLSIDALSSSDVVEISSRSRQSMSLSFEATLCAGATLKSLGVVTCQGICLHTIGFGLKMKASTDYAR